MDRRPRAGAGAGQPDRGGRHLRQQPWAYRPGRPPHAVWRHQAKRHRQGAHPGRFVRVHRIPRDQHAQAGKWRESMKGVRHGCRMDTALSSKNNLQGKRKMFKSRVKSCLATIAAVVGLGLAAEASAAQANLAQLAALQGDTRQQSLVDGAKKVGEVTIYFAHPSIRAIATAFTEKYGIKVNQWRSGSEGLLQRVMSESRGGKYSVDLVENNAPEMEALHRESLLQRMESPLMAHLMP